ncbi:MAG: enoyl-ACP reductase [Bacteroidetes bacterium]|nr:enoyl-ACP reductase [Bacteroidota bacterium]
MLMQGKQGLVCGVANKRSIAHAIAKSLHREGAKLAFTYQGDRLKKNVEEIAGELGSKLLYNCDVTKDEDIKKLFEDVKKDLGHLDFLVHAIAFANKDDLEKNFSTTSREGFRVAHDISAYSLIGVSREAAPLMQAHGGSIVTLSYYGAEKVIPGYNVMGVAKASLEASVRYLAADLGQHNIRVNAVSAGPINTLAARGISGFTKILDMTPQKAPLKRNVEVDEVGDAALFMLSSLSRGITGEVLYVDCGYNIVGM